MRSNKPALGCLRSCVGSTGAVVGSKLAWTWVHAGEASGGLTADEPSWESGQRQFWDVYIISHLNVLESNLVPWPQEARIGNVIWLKTF